MGDLAVTVHLGDAVVEHRVVPVRRAVRLGERPGAAVAFPGADLAVVRMGDRLGMRGHLLAEGDTVEMSLGRVHVVLEHTVRARRAPEWLGLFDARFLAAILLVTVLGSWLEAVQGWLEARALAGGPLDTARRAVLAVRDAAPGRTAAAVPGNAEQGAAARPARDLADGPRHEPDDDVTGMGWYPWYRRAVPDSEAQVSDALAALAADPADPAARWALARAAYDEDDFEAAAEHYRWLVERFPYDREARLRLAWSLRRLGMHRAEVREYRRVLEQDADDLRALGGLAVALARLRRFDEASRRLDELMVRAPDLPYTDLVAAEVEALLGHEDRALAALRRAIEHRGQMSEEMQIEMRRDIALDPVFSSLRRDRKLAVLVASYYWAAGPTPVR